MPIEHIPDQSDEEANANLSVAEPIVAAKSSSAEEPISDQAVAERPSTEADSRDRELKQTTARRLSPKADQTADNGNGDEEPSPDQAVAGRPSTEAAGRDRELKQTTARRLSLKTDETADNGNGDEEPGPHDRTIAGSVAAAATSENATSPPRPVSTDQDVPDESLPAAPSGRTVGGKSHDDNSPVADLLDIAGESTDSETVPGQAFLSWLSAPPDLSYHGKETDYEQPPAPGSSDSSSPETMPDSGAVPKQRARPFKQRGGPSVWVTSTNLRAMQLSCEIGFDWIPTSGAASRRALEQSEEPTLSAKAAPPESPAQEDAPSKGVSEQPPEPSPVSAPKSLSYVINLQSLIPQRPSLVGQPLQIAGAEGAPIPSFEESAAADECATLLESAHQALLRAQFEESAQKYEQALQLLESSPEPRRDQLQSCLSDLVDAYMFLGQPDKALAACRRLHALDRHGAGRNLIIVLLKVAKAHELAGDTATAETAYLEALNVAGDTLPLDDPLHGRLTESLKVLHKKRSSALASHEPEQLSEINRSRKRELLSKQRSAETPLPGKAEGPVKREPPAKALGQRMWWHLLQILDHPFLHSTTMRSNAVLIPLSTVLLFLSIVIFSFLHFERRNEPPKKVVTAKQSVYKSCDNNKSLRFQSANRCDFVQNGVAARGSLKAVTGGDLLSLIAGSMRPHRERWFQRTEAGLVDSDGTILYPPDAPELAVAQKTLFYANLAASNYKESRLYPNDASKLKKLTTRFSYINPFSGKADEPVVLFKKLAAADKTWTARTQAGQQWSDEPAWRPGDIHCLCLDYCQFYVRGFDRNAQPLTTSEPGRCFIAVLKDGVCTTGELAKHDAKTIPDKDTTPLYIYVADTAGIQAEVWAIKSVVPVILWVSVIGSVCWCIKLGQLGQLGQATSAVGEASKTSAIGRVGWLPMLVSACCLTMLALWYCLIFSQP